MLLSKLTSLFDRMVDVFRLFPQRLLRLFQHLLIGLQGKHHLLSRPDPGQGSPILLRPVHWWIESTLYLLELLGAGEIYETLMDIVKWNTRPLTEREISLAQSIFGNNIRYKRVRVDEYALIGPRQMRICYVSFFMINSWKGMPDTTLIHELTHIWQYQQFGAVYMARALRAQFSKPGYDYGGLAAIRAYLLKGLNLTAFNFEQQADIVEDFFRLKNGLPPCWGKAKETDLDDYEKVLHPLLSGQRASE